MVTAVHPAAQQLLIAVHTVQPFSRHRQHGLAQNHPGTYPRRLLNSLLLALTLLAFGLPLDGDGPTLGARGRLRSRSRGQGGTAPRPPPHGPAPR